MRKRWLAPAMLAAAALAVTACGSANGNGKTGGTGATSPPSSSAAGGGAMTGGAVVKARTVKGKVLLVNDKGLTLYWFTADKNGKSACNSSCASYWPPVPGPVKAGSHSHIKASALGEIKRSDGSEQATFDGHPLYLYASDTKPGMASGNGLTSDGGTWKDIPIKGLKPRSDHRKGKGKKGKKGHKGKKNKKNPGGTMKKKKKHKKSGGWPKG